jgi:GNAT superfamily N-acetyltransferase
VPFGAAQVLVSEFADTSVSGLVYACPPQRLIAEYANLGPTGQQALARRIAEIELLAVDETARGRGVGAALLSAIERDLVLGGCRLVIAKVRAGALDLMHWYHRRGYVIADQGETVLLKLGGVGIGFDDAGDGYQIAAKLTDPGMRFVRQMIEGTSCLVVGPAGPRAQTARTVGLKP